MCRCAVGRWDFGIAGSWALRSALCHSALPTGEYCISVQPLSPITEWLSHDVRSFPLWCQWEREGLSVTVQSVTVCDLMYGGLLHVVKVPFDSLSGRACRPPRLRTVSLHIPAISLFRVEPHTETPSVFMCVLRIFLSITSMKGQAAAVDTLTLLPLVHHLSFLLPTSSSRRVCFSKHSCQGPE